VISSFCEIDQLVAQPPADKGYLKVDKASSQAVFTNERCRWTNAKTGNVFFGSATTNRIGIFVALHATGAKKITATFVTAIFADGNAVN
jgi:hypothetical protein